MGGLPRRERKSPRPCRSAWPCVTMRVECVAGRCRWLLFRARVLSCSDLAAWARSRTMGVWDRINIVAYCRHGFNSDIKFSDVKTPT
jgi:hypothetical protein